MNTFYALCGLSLFTVTLGIAACTSEAAQDTGDTVAADTAASAADGGAGAACNNNQPCGAGFYCHYPSARGRHCSSQRDHASHCCSRFGKNAGWNNFEQCMDAVIEKGEFATSQAHDETLSGTCAPSPKVADCASAPHVPVVACGGSYKGGIELLQNECYARAYRAQRVDDLVESTADLNFKCSDDEVTIAKSGPQAH